jgi:hypothetical protein
MIKPKNFILIIFVVVVTSHYCVSQTVSVKKEKAIVKGVNTEGYKVVLDGKEINSAFVKYLKTFSKVKQGYDYHTLSEVNLNGKTNTQNVYAFSKENGSNVEAWIGIKADEWPTGDVEDINKQLEKVLYDFGIQYYRDKIQLQINESNQALQAVEKQQQRLVNQNRDLSMKLEDNKREKIQLEKALENNKVELETLLKKIDQNKKDQDSVQIANQQIKKIIDMQKEKQSKVGSAK